MSGADLLSIFINLAVGIYFALLYPRSLQKRFGARPAPRAFVLLQRYLPPVGWLIIALTIIYGLTLLFSS